MKNISFALLAGLLVLLISCSDPTGTKEEPSKEFNMEFYNPIMPGVADPFVAYHDGMYYMAASTGSGLAIYKSKTLSGFMASTNSPRVVWQTASQGLSELWAPEIHFIDGFWYAYFACLDTTVERGTGPWDNRRRMFVIKSRTADPEGVWEFEGRLELPGNSWAIDGTLFKNTDEKFYFIWSGWKNNNITVNEQQLYICEMDSPALVKAGTSRVLISEADYSWEKQEAPINEGPIIFMQPDGKIKCIYSASASWDDHYCLGELALSGNPMLPASWAKKSTPIFQGDPGKGIYSPGHNSFTTSPDGKEIWMVYHIAKQQGSGWDRCTRIQKAGFNASGNIVMGSPLSGNEAYTLPSGEIVDRYLFDMENGTLSGAQKASIAGAHGGMAVTFINGDSSVELEVDVPAGEYNVFLRYNHSFNESRTAVMKLNDVLSNFELRKCGGIFSMIGGRKITLPEGKSSLVFSAGSYVVLDSVILERI
jgi:GH43 family beta-xylosidase